jgi:hypothetical protein
MTNTKKTLREARALLTMFAKNREPLRESPYVRMAKVIVAGSKR